MEFLVKPVLDTLERSKQTRSGMNLGHNYEIRTERTVAKSNPKSEHTEHFPDLKADKPTKAEETFNADS